MRVRGPAMRHEDESGMTLIELVVAFLIFAILMLGIAHTMGTGLALTRTNKNRSIAANLAAQEMDLIRSSDFEAVVENPGRTLDIDGVVYTVTREVNWTQAGTAVSPCDAPAGENTPEVLHVRVLVSWPDMNGIAPVASDTTVSPPIGGYDVASGHIAVEVTDHSGNPMQGVPVVISDGPEVVPTRATNSDGCAFFGFVDPGTYRATLNAAGHVDELANTTPFKMATVVAVDTEAVAFVYAPAARFDVTLASPGGYPIPADLPVTAGNTNIFPTKQRTIEGTGVTRTIDGLFPYDNGYQLWGGACADADPEGTLTAEGGDYYWPDASRGDLHDAIGGAAVAVDVTLHDADIRVSDGSGGPVADVEVVAEHADDRFCASESHALGRTAADGTLRVALPYGHWDIVVVGRETSGPQLVLDPRDPVAGSVTVVAS